MTLQGDMIKSWSLYFYWTLRMLLVEMQQSIGKGPELADFPHDLVGQSADSEPVCFDLTLMATDNVFMSCQMRLAQP